MLTPAELLERFHGAGSNALRPLSHGSRDLPKRHRSIEDTISWSYDLLTADGQRLLLMLSVFEAGCTLDAVPICR